MTLLIEGAPGAFLTQRTSMTRTLLAVALLSLSALAAETPLINLVPADAQVIGGLNVTRTLSSPFGQFLLNQIKTEDAGFRKLVEETGFDPRLHLRDVVFASPSTAKHSGLVIARGVFNGPQILATIQKKGGTLTTYNGVQILLEPKGNAGVAIMEGSLAFAGEERLIKAAIDRRAAGTPSGALARKAADFDTRYDAWMVANGAAIPAMPTGSNVPPQAAAFSAIVESSGGVEFGSVIRITGEAVARSAKDAQALVDVFKFVAAMAQLNKDNPDAQRFEPIINSMTVTASGTAVKFTAAIPQADLELLMKPQRKAKPAAAASLR